MRDSAGAEGFWTGCTKPDRVVVRHFGDPKLATGFFTGRLAMHTATVRWVGGEEFLATMPSGQAVPIDADRKHNSAPGPMDMLLGALGACSSVDVVLILAKKRQKLVSLEVAVSGERASEPPAVWTKIDMVYKLAGELEQKAVRDAIELSQTKYCSVAAMLRKTAEISYRFEIAPAESERQKI